MIRQKIFLPGRRALAKARRRVMVTVPPALGGTAWIAECPVQLVYPAAVTIL